MKNLPLTSLSRRASQQLGMSIVECLVALTILAFSGLAVTKNSITAISYMKRSVRHQAALQLATEKMEQLAAVNPITLTAASSLVEVNLLLDQVSFKRSTTISVNADRSRTVDVLVTGTVSSRGGRSHLTSTFGLWGAQS